MTRADDIAEMIRDSGEDIRFRGNVIEALLSSQARRREYGEDGNFIRVRVMRVMLPSATIAGGPVTEGETLEHDSTHYRVAGVSVAEGVTLIDCEQELSA